MKIVEDDLTGKEIQALLTAHLTFAAEVSPPESVHALDLSGLRAPEITFWTAWNGADLLGCGALKELGKGHGEIKSMHTAHNHRGKGVAAAILKHAMETARSRSYKRLSLETGSNEPFAPARALYTRHGFSICEPFADYAEDPFSLHMTLKLSG